MWHGFVTGICVSEKGDLKATKNKSGIQKLGDPSGHKMAMKKPFFSSNNISFSEVCKLNFLTTS